MSLTNPFFLSGLGLVLIGLIRAGALYVQVVRTRKQEGKDAE
ncbi:hypothetical protein [Streptomyces ipomoeae]|nr:hypothetical protein [Streptomyces ipomoeae]MDX2935444.1 hypothetical protein [Streptomyces ipomoeae]